METMNMMDSRRSMMGNDMGMVKNMMMNNGMGINMANGQMNMMNMMMMPRMSMKMEKCENGLKMMFSSKEPTAAAMMQNLCSMMSGCMTSMCMMMNGMMMMNCNMMMGMCRCEMTSDGMYMTWTSGDAMTSKMIEECCTCMMSMMECGCTAVMCMNNTPVCCCF